MTDFTVEIQINIRPDVCLKRHFLLWDLPKYDLEKSLSWFGNFYIVIYKNLKEWRTIKCRNFDDAVKQAELFRVVIKSGLLKDLDNEAINNTAE